jgi:hypothetical protein
MGLLEKAIVQQLLALSPKEKRDTVQGRLINLLGAAPNTSVSNLPPRRGKADGGLDGRVLVLVPPRLISAEEPSAQEPTVPVETEAAINLKIEKAKFSRKELGAFVNDMQRERLKVGLIITASGLSPDATSETERHHREGNIVLAHYLLEELLSDNPPGKGIVFKAGHLAETIKQNLTAYLAGNQE